MATKPDPVNDLPPAWGSAGNYAAGVYGATLPWGDPNPLAGLPLPWGTQPRLNTTNLTSFAADGFTPQIPNDASVYNEWLRRVQVWVPWIISGTAAPDEDAHIVETDASGFVKKHGFFSTIGFVDASGNAAPLPQGASIAAGKDLAMDINTTIDGTNTTIAKVAEVEFQTGGAALSATGIGVSAGGELFFTTSLRIHASPNGFVYATGDQEASTGLAAAHTIATTTASAVAIGNGLVRVICQGQFQVNSLGSTVTIAVQDDQGGFANIAPNRVITALVDNSDANDWQDFRIERVFNAGLVTATLFRLSSSSQGGITHQMREVNLRVVSERA